MRLIHPALRMVDHASSLTLEPNDRLLLGDEAQTCEQLPKFVT